MARHATAGTSSRPLVAVVIAGALLALAAESSDERQPDPEAEDVATRAAAAFAKLDQSPADGVLAGPELESVSGYDADADGRVTPEEFVRGFTSVKPAPRWVRQEFKRQGFACEMPGTPEPLDSEGAALFQVAVTMEEPEVLLVARMRDMPARAAGKAGPFFDTLVEQLEASGATVLGRQAADLGLHRGSVVAARREDGSMEVVRSVVVGRTVYELHALLPPDHGAPAREVVDRFFRSLELVR